MSTSSKISKVTLGIIVLLSIFIGLVATSQAASLPTSLQGTYVVRNAVVFVNGYILQPTIKKISIPIGATGLKAVTSTKIKNVLAQNGAGTGLTVTITSKTTKTLALNITGSLATQLGTADLLPGTNGTAVLSASGLKITVNVLGNISGFPVAGKQTVTLKKL